MRNDVVAGRGPLPSRLIVMISYAMSGGEEWYLIVGSKERTEFCSSIPSLPAFKRDRIVLLYLAMASSYADAAASSVSSLPCFLPNSACPTAVTSFIRRFLTDPDNAAWTTVSRIMGARPAGHVDRHPL